MQLATCQNLTDTPRGSQIFGMPNDLHRAILTAVIELDVSHEVCVCVCVDALLNPLSIHQTSLYIPPIPVDFVGMSRDADNSFKTRFPPQIVLQH